MTSSLHVYDKLLIVNRISNEDPQNKASPKNEATWVWEWVIQINLDKYTSLIQQESKYVHL